jgi:hypothetical protein
MSPSSPMSVPVSAILVPMVMARSLCTTAPPQKLDMDLSGHIDVDLWWRCHMDEERARLVSRMFAQLTARLEDGAAIAADGQGPHETKALQRLANELIDIAQDALTVAEAIAELTSTTE